MAEWLIEEGIGERRALLVKDGAVLAARLQRHGELVAGQVAMARLASKTAGARRGLAILDDGTEVLVDHLPPSLTEGERFSLRISRAAIAQRGRFKRAQGRHVEGGVPENEAPSPASPFAGRVVPAFEAGLWEEVWDAASTGSLAFPGGEILLSATPAMTLIDVDGEGSSREVALAAIPAIVRALHWFAIGGNVGIDFPTLATKADRRAVDEALDAQLRDWPCERTAMNGFGFVQIVARLEAASLIDRFTRARRTLCALKALRVAERAQGAGPVLLLSAHPALAPKLKPEWIEELVRRTGRQVRIETNPTLAIEAPGAQIVGA